MTTEVDIAAIKNEGNDCFAAGDHDAALALYTKGLAACGDGHDALRAAMLCNRAACHLRFARWEACVGDCDAALVIDPARAKAVCVFPARRPRLIFLRDEVALIPYAARGCPDPAIFLDPAR